jgi:puromycin-sensitive aminopeptidase
MPSRKDIRLSRHVRPHRYSITLKPDFERFTFAGNETIRITLAKPTREITLHSKELSIEVAEAIKGSEKIFALKTRYGTKRETATFIFPKILPKGEITLRLVFTGILNDKMHGFYRSHYTEGGKREYLAVTQFEATDARRAFPCFDEPDQKAVFDVNLIVPEEHVAISNTIPTETREHEAGYKIVTFAPTPKMSTYLLAFIVGKFEHIEKKTSDGVLVRVFVAPGKKHQASFALECAVKTLPFFTKYFGIAYPLPVLDLIAIPDFAAGAMENWGAVTYRESMLLVDPDHTSAATKQWVALVIAHELAHQWFGNLVTMEWWTHLWLNEGFASYIEYLAVDHLFPKWDIWTQFAYQDLGRALELDALKHSHPIEVDVHDPNEISEIFDAVSYSKGASVIRMLADYIGEKNFRDGLRYYLKKHSYKNTSTIHLWQAFERVSGKPVSEIMRHWTSRPGYPLLSVEERGNKIEIRQKRFFSSPISARAKENTVWPIPVRMKRDASRQSSQFLMSGKRLTLPRRGKWLKLNSGEYGVYRTKYSPSLRAAFEEPIRRKALEPRDRLGLIRDAFAISEAAELPVSEALRLAENYKKETDYTVWVEVASGLSDIYALIAHERFLERYKKFCRGVFADIARQVGWHKRSGEQHTETLLRSLVLGSFGNYGDLKTIAHTKKLFASITARKNPVPADLRSMVYAVTAHYGSGREYEKMVALYKKATLHEEKNRIGRALAHFSDQKLLKRTLSFSLSKHVRNQDTISMVASVWMNPRGRELAWKFVRANWKTFLNRYGGQHAFSSLLSPASSFMTRAKADEFRRFFKTHPAPGAERTVKQCIEKIHANAAWLAREAKALNEFLI